MMKKLTIILFGLIGIAYGQVVKVSPGVTVLAPSDTVGKYIRPIAGTNMTITGTFPNLTFNATASGSGTVTAISVATANGFAGTSSGGATPIITLTTPITGILKGNGTAISAATAGTDYGRVDSVRFVNSGLIHTTPAAFSLSGSTAVITQTLVSQTANTVLAGAVSGGIAAPTFRALVPLDIPTLNQSTTGSAASFTGSLAGEVSGTQSATVVSNAAVIAKVLTGYVSGAGTVAASDNILQAVQKINGNVATNTTNIATNTTNISTTTTNIANRIKNDATLEELRRVFEFYDKY